MNQLFERESEGLFSVRQSILGHIQQGGDPSPFDRIQATRLSAKSLEHLIDHVLRDTPTSCLIGLEHGKIRFTRLDDFPELIEHDVQRPIEQSWMALRPLAKVMARPGMRNA
jgi:6-phosphofructokinase 1